VRSLVGILGVSTLLALTATACGGHGRVPLACGPVRAVTPTRDPAIGDGIALGPLQLDLYPFRPGYPLKVLIGSARPPRTPVTIRGWRCSDGTPLRFWYGGTEAALGLRLSGRRYPAAVLERAGRADAYLKPSSSQPGGREWPGYFLFPTAGRYEVKLYAGSSLLDTAVIGTAEHAR
jgi:hypothetical protein